MWKKTKVGLGILTNHKKKQVRENICLWPYTWACPSSSERRSWAETEPGYCLEGKEEDIPEDPHDT